MTTDIGAKPFRSGAASAATEHPLERSEAAESRIMMAVAIGFSVLYFALGALRYNSFRAGAMDMGVFDQPVYLMSRGLTPFVNVLGYHMLADHASFILYPISLLYRIYPSVYWLIGVQDVALAAGGWLVWRLAREAGVSSGLAKGLGVTYLIYPTIVGASIFDFHPDTLAVPALLGAVLCCRRGWIMGFLALVCVALSTKEALSLTVCAMGIWLFIFEKKRTEGVLSLLLGMSWYVVATKLVIPAFGEGHQLDSLRFFSQYGHSAGQIVRTLILKPKIPLGYLLSKRAVLYVVLILAPVWWALSPKRLSPLIGALPALGINLLSNSDNLRNPFYQYSLQIVPFLFLAAIAAIASGNHWLRSGRAVAIWIALCIVGGAGLRAAKMNVHESIQGVSNEERRRVIEMVNNDGGVLTTHQIEPHLTHRQFAAYVLDPKSEALLHSFDTSQVEWVLLDFSEDSLKNTGKFGVGVLERCQADSTLDLTYHHDDLYLFHRRTAP